MFGRARGSEAALVQHQHMLGMVHRVGKAVDHDNAARALPGQPLDAAIDQIKSYNLHIFVMRRPAGLLLGSDVVFVEPPLR